MRTRRSIAAIAVYPTAMLLAAGTVVSAQDAARSGANLVKQGNTLLAEGKFEEALGAYDKAAEQLPDSPVVAYDRGIALYRLGEFAKAEPAFQDALKPGHPELEAMAKYNLGRCTHASALAQKEDLQAAVNDLSRAILFYQDALQIQPDDQDAQQNMALAERLRAFLEKRLEQQEQEKEKEQPTSQPDRQPTSQPDQQQEPTSQPTSQPQQGDDEQQEQQGDQQQQSRQQGDKQDQSQQGKQGDQDEQKGAKQGDEQNQAKERGEGKLTPEEVEPMLQEARDAEAQRREAKRRKAMRLRGRIPVKKDW